MLSLSLTTSFLTLLTVHVLGTLNVGAANIQTPGSLIPASGAELARPPSPRQSIPTLLGRSASVPFDNPLKSGGSMLTIVNGTYPPGLGEPLNVILSAESDSTVLLDNIDKGGFQNYMLSTYLATECLGEHYGDPQQANLGGKEGNVSQIQELRWDFGNPYIGTCEETFSGGLHLRYWKQNSTGAIFIAVSVEKDLAAGHDIILDGYNLGRDYLVGNLTGTNVPSRQVTNHSTYLGSTSYNNYTYQTNVTYVSGLLQNSSDGINHYLTVQEDGYPAIDGLVALLTVKITSRPVSASIETITRFSLPLLISTLIISTFYILI